MEAEAGGGSSRYWSRKLGLELLATDFAATFVSRYTPGMPSDRVQRHIDRLLDEADEAIALRQWEELRATCETLLSLDPDNSDASRYLILANDSLATKVVSDSSEVVEPSQDQIPPLLNHEGGFFSWKRSSQITGIDGRITREGFVFRAFLATAAIGFATLLFITFFNDLWDPQYSSMNTANFAYLVLMIYSAFSMLFVWGALVVIHSSVVRRFHDFNWGGVRILLLLVPIVNIAIVFMLLFRSGTQGTNDYGNEPEGLTVGY